MASLSGKVAIITGPSSGIGRAIAERFAEGGAIVVVNYAKHAEKAQDVVTGIQSKGGKAVAVQADMSQVAKARRLVLDTFRQFSRLDILVNNAGKVLKDGGRIVNISSELTHTNCGRHEQDTREAGIGPVTTSPGWRSHGMRTLVCRSWR